MYEQALKQGAELVGSAGEKQQVVAAFTNGLDPVRVCSVSALLLSGPSMSFCLTTVVGEGTDC